MGGGAAPGWSTHPSLPRGSSSTHQLSPLFPPGVLSTLRADHPRGHHRGQPSLPCQRGDPERLGHGRVGSGGPCGRAYLPDHAVPHASHPLAVLAVGHQVQVVGELDHLGQFLEDVDAETLAAELRVGGGVTAAATKRAQESEPALRPAWRVHPAPTPGERACAKPATPRRLAAHALRLTTGLCVRSQT